MWLTCMVNIILHVAHVDGGIILHVAHVHGGILHVAHVHGGITSHKKFLKENKCM